MAFALGPAGWATGLVRSLGARIGGEKPRALDPIETELDLHVADIFHGDAMEIDQSNFTVDS
jgi:hypothetical protein